MHETNPGRGGDACTRPVDDFLRLECMPRETIDLGAELGADPAPSDRYRDIRNALIIALIISGWANPERRLAYPRDRNAMRLLKRYLGPMASHRGLLWAVQSLESAGLIHHRKARPGPSPKGQKRHRSTIRATAKLLETSPVAHIHEIRRVIWEPIRLKNGNGHLEHYRETELTRSWRSDARAQNQALEGLQLCFARAGWQEDAHGFLHKEGRVLNPAHIQLYRVCNLNWRHGGRWYGGLWQGLKRAERALIRIHETAVVESDYRCLHPRLLAACIGCELGNEDPYQVPGFPRSLVKKAFNTLINADSERVAILALEDELRRTPSGPPWQQARQVVDAIKARHLSFADAWGSGIGLRLQAIDARNVRRGSARDTERGHPVLSSTTASS